MAVKMTDEEYEFHQRWSHVGGKVAGFDEAINMVKADAGLFFIQKKDDLARYVRELAESLEQRKEPALKELHRCIGDKRTFEVESQATDSRTAEVSEGSTSA